MGLLYGASPGSILYAILVLLASGIIVVVTRPALSGGRRGFQSRSFPGYS